MDVGDGGGAGVGGVGSVGVVVPPDAEFEHEELGRFVCVCMSVRVCVLRVLCVLCACVRTCVHTVLVCGLFLRCVRAHAWLLHNFTQLPASYILCSVCSLVFCKQNTMHRQTHTYTTHTPHTHTHSHTFTHAHTSHTSRTSHTHKSMLAYPHIAAALCRAALDA